MSCQLVLDVGGTGIKCGVFKDYRTLLLEPWSFPARSGEGQEEIVSHFVSILKKLIRWSPEPVTGAGFAFPGPFDYEKGVSLMRGIGKYDSIYGVHLPEAFLRGLKEDPQTAPRLASSFDMAFCNDIDGYALGAARAFPDLLKGRALFICLGTGCGSAFMEEGRFTRSPLPDLAQNGWVFHNPFRETIVDDYLSARGLKRLAEERGIDLDGKALSLLAQRGDPAALEIFKVFGENFRDGLAPVIDGWKPDFFVLGGQIAKSFPLFGGEMERFLTERGCTLRIYTEATAPLNGLAALLEGRAGR